MPYRLSEEEYARIIVARQGTLTGVSTVTNPLDTSTTPDVTTTTSSTTSTADTTTTTSTADTTTTSSTTTSSAITTNTGTTTSGGTTDAGTTTGTSSGLSTSGLTSMTSATVVVTGSNGVVTTVFSTIPVVTGTQSANHGSGSSNTGAIVGGVVGGIGGLALLVVLFWFFRKRSKDQELEGDIFDPDRNVQRPGRFRGDVDLTDPQMEARPYNYNGPVSTGHVAANATGATAGVAGVGAAGALSHSTHDEASSPYYNHHGPAPGQIFNYPQQYGESPYPPMQGAAAGRPPSEGYQGAPGPVSDLSRGPSSGSAWVPSSSAYNDQSSSSHPATTDDGRASIGAAFLGIPATSASSHSASSRTKAQQAQALRLANAGGDDDAAGPVVQHQDGGRVRDTNQSPAPQEVPPAYDSIPQDEPGPSGGPSTGAAARAEAARPEKAPRFAA